MGTYPFCLILLRQTEVVGRQRDRDLSGDEVHGTHGNKVQQEFIISGKPVIKYTNYQGAKLNQGSAREVTG